MRHKDIDIEEVPVVTVEKPRKIYRHVGTLPIVDLHGKRYQPGDVIRDPEKLFGEHWKQKPIA